MLFRSPLLENFIEMLPDFHGKIVFTADFSSFFFQIRKLRSQALECGMMDPTTGDWYSNVSLDQGHVNSPSIAQHVVSNIVLSQSNWEKFRKDFSHLYPNVNMHPDKARTWKAYIDDVSARVSNADELLYCLHFLLLMCHQNDLRLSPSKFSLKYEVQILGFSVNSLENKYSMNSERVSGLLQSPLALSKKAIKSKLCQYSYFSCAIPFLRECMLLNRLLAKSKDDTITMHAVHLQEQVAARLLIAMRASFVIPNPNAACLVSTDASASCISGLAFQETKHDKDVLDFWRCEKMKGTGDRKSTRLNSSHSSVSRMPSSA